MVPVLASLVALALGPALMAASRGQRWVLGGVDGFVVVSIGGIVLLHMLPHAYLVGGPSMLLIAAVGLFGPTLIERVVGPRLPVATRWMLPAALLGLALHAMLDGVVLVESHDGHAHDEPASDGLMALGVVLHRIPEGLAIWWVFRRQHGLRAALFALAVIAVATTLGFVLAEHLEHFLGPLHGIQALVAGSLLHVLVHRSHDLLAPAAHGHTGPHADHHPDHAHPEHPDTHPEHPDTITRPRRADHVPAAIGALLGVAMLWGVALAHPASHRIANELAMGTTFSLLAFRLAPALLASFAAVAIVAALWPVGFDRWLGRHSPPTIALITFACAMALLGAPLAVPYLLGALLVRAVSDAFGPRLSPPFPTPDPALLTPRSRLVNSVRLMLRAVDHTLPWLLLGLGVGAFVEPSVAPGALALSPLVAVPLAALLGWPSYLFPAGLVPLLAVMVHKGLPPGAALAILLTAPVHQGSAFRRMVKISWLVVPATLLIAIALGALPASWLASSHPLTLHDDATTPPTVVEIASLVALTALALVSLVRRGPRAWVEQIVGEDDHTH